jgi:hypothetical protein
MKARVSAERIVELSAMRGVIECHMRKMRNEGEARAQKTRVGMHTLECVPVEEPKMRDVAKHGAGGVGEKWFGEHRRVDNKSLEALEGT